MWSCSSQQYFRSLVEYSLKRVKISLAHYNAVYIVSMWLLWICISRLLLSSLDFILQEWNQKAAGTASRPLFKHGDKKHIKPVRSASALQDGFMPYKIDIVHWIIAVCCIFRALYIPNESFIPWINLYAGNCVISANMIMWHSDSWPFWRNGNKACSNVRDRKNMNGYCQVISFSWIFFMIWMNTQKAKRLIASVTIFSGKKVSPNMYTAT